MRIDPDYTLSTLTDLVRINSVNPAFGDGSTNEREIASYVGRALDALGMEVVSHEPEPGRVSVVGRLRGAGERQGGGRTRSVMLYAHMDTVGVEGMVDPFGAAVRAGRLYGRGSYDMKGALAACMGAVECLARAAQPLGGDVMLVAVADEEAASLGMVDVLEHHTADAAIVTEPTALDVCLAHKGFSWIEVETLGRAAHGSRFEDGIDANMRMGRLLARLDVLERELRASTPHPLVGPPSLHAGVLEGGTGASIYAARCRAEIERRTIPGESEAYVIGQIQRLIDELAASDATFAARLRPLLTRESFEVAPDAAIARVVHRAATEVRRAPPAYVGMAYWMDAALLATAGIETVVIGPAGGGAHAAEEWVDLHSVTTLGEILARAAVDYCGAAGEFE